MAIPDKKDRSVLYALLGVAALGALSLVLLMIANGPPPPKTAPLSALPSATTAPPTSGPAAARLAQQCRQIRATLAPLVPVTTSGPVGRPAGVPVGAGPEVASCRMAVGASGRPAVATRYRRTSVRSYADQLVQYGWQRRDASSKAGTSEELYTQLDGTHQIVLLGLPDGDLIALYDGV